MRYSAIYEQDVEKIRQLCSRGVQRLDVPKNVRLASSPPAAAPDDLFEHPAAYSDAICYHLRWCVSGSPTRFFNSLLDILDKTLSLLTRQQIFGLAFFAILLFLVYQLALMFQPFLLAMVWATVLAHLLYPLYSRLTVRLGGRESLAAAILTVVIMLLGVLPLIWMGGVIVREAVVLEKSIRIWVGEGGLERLPEHLSKLPLGGEYLRGWYDRLEAGPDNLEEMLISSAKSLSQFLVGGLTGFVKNVFAFFANALIMIVTLFFFIVGSVIGTAHVAWWTAQPALQPVSVVTAFGPWTALAMSLAIFGGITWFIHMTTPIFSIGSYDFSWRDLVLIAGGLFLLVKGTREMHQDIEGNHDESVGAAASNTMTSAIVQIALIDLVFSVDSIITAVGMADHVEVMIAAVAVAIAVMYFASEPVAAFIERHPTTKILALSFLLLIGAALIADGFHFHIPRGYIYFAMAFSAAAEVVNVIAMRNRRKPKPAKAGEQK